MSITNLNNSKAMKNFKTNTKDAKKLLQTIKAEFISKAKNGTNLKGDYNSAKLSIEQMKQPLWFNFIEYDGSNEYLIFFQNSCQESHTDFNDLVKMKSTGRLSMGCIRLKYTDVSLADLNNGGYIVQMSKQITYDDLNMDAIDL